MTSKALQTIFGKRMTILPTGDRIIVQSKQQASVTAGGIHLPDTAKGRTVWGEVVAVGPGRMTDKGNVIPVAVRVGDEVMYEEHAGIEIEVDAQPARIMAEGHVLAVASKRKQAAALVRK